MPFVTPEPTIITQVNWYNFENAHVLTREGTIVLDCRRGYLASSDAKVVEYDLVPYAVSSDDYAAALSKPIAAGMTLGEAVVTAAYALLIAAGVIPSDAIEVKDSGLGGSAPQKTL